VILRARTVLTMAGPTVDNGAVAISGDRIAAVGAFDEIMKSNTGDVLDLGERILLPGFTNALPSRLHRVTVRIEPGTHSLTGSTQSTPPGKN
jgi:hypothetical protein